MTLTMRGLGGLSASVCLICVFAATATFAQDAENNATEASESSADAGASDNSGPADDAGPPDAASIEAAPSEDTSINEEPAPAAIPDVEPEIASIEPAIEPLAAVLPLPVPAPDSRPYKDLSNSELTERATNIRDEIAEIAQLLEAESNPHIEILLANLSRDLAIVDAEIILRRKPAGSILQEAKAPAEFCDALFSSSDMSGCTWRFQKVQKK